MSDVGEPSLLHRRLIHQGQELRITLDRVRLPNGHELELEMVHHPGAAAVVPFVSDDEVLLVRQYRWAASQWIYEIPAGKLRPGEAPEACAARELEEEVGHRAGRLERLGDIWTAPGFTDETIALFAARELTPVAQALEPDEVLEVERVPLARALDLARDGRLRDAKSLCALFHVLLRAREQRIE
jgi:ADP-ribose pyrophosphatase